MENTRTELSIKDMPAVERFLDCALPIMFVDYARPEFPGIGGTCFAVRYGGRVFFLTAGHCLKDVEADNLAIPVTFNRPLETWTISRIGRPAVTRRSEYGTGLDVAIMIPGVEPAFEAGEAQPIDLEFVAQMVDVPTKALFAVRGYPKGSGIDYDQFEIARDSFALLGGYDGPMRGFPGCHSLRASSAMVGGPDGLSGSPVARVLRRQDGSWAAALAGMVVMGGPERLHFVEVGTIMDVLKSASNSQR